MSRSIRSQEGQIALRLERTLLHTLHLVWFKRMSDKRGMAGVLDGVGNIAHTKPVTGVADTVNIRFADGGQSLLCIAGPQKHCYARRDDLVQFVKVRARVSDYQSMPK